MSGDVVHNDIDVLVIGGGIAGTVAAIKAKQAGAGKVLQVDKGHVGKSGNSAFAAGVIHAFFPEDDLHDRVRRTARANEFVSDQGCVQDYLEGIMPLIQEMDSWGVRFGKTADGKLERKPGRGFYPVIGFYGFQLMDAMMKAALKHGVEQMNHTMITGLLTRDGTVIGAVGFNVRTGDFHTFLSKATVVATGSTFYEPEGQSSTGFARG